MKDKHKELQETGMRWLFALGCSIFAKEVPTGNGVADAFGIKIRRGRRESTYYIEAKASRSDLICKKQKLVYRNSIGAIEPWCWRHDPDMYRSMFTGDTRTEGWKECEECLNAKARIGDTGIDFYYLIVADGILVEPSLYPEWGILDERGNIKRRAKRMKREMDVKNLLIATAHVLVYKAYGKLYL